MVIYGRYPMNLAKLGLFEWHFILENILWKLKNQEHLKVQSGTLARYALKNGLFSSSLVFNCNKLCIFFSELNI